MATMPERYHRVIYRPLPDGETWVIAEIDGEPVIIVSEALDDAGRRRARREARASLHGRGLALAPARTTPPPARDRPSAGPGGRDTPPAHGRDCGGIHVGVPPGVDLCLLG
jgi:hypothetical protein